MLAVSTGERLIRVPAQHKRGAIGHRDQNLTRLFVSVGKNCAGPAGRLRSPITAEGVRTAPCDHVRNSSRLVHRVQ